MFGCNDKINTEVNPTTSYSEDNILSRQSLTKDADILDCRGPSVAAEAYDIALPLSRRAPQPEYSVTEVLAVRNALKFTSKILKESAKRWGPDKDLLLCAHAAEVGMLLAATKQPAEVIQAGFLYAVQYFQEETTRTTIENPLRRKFSQPACNLVDALCDRLNKPQSFAKIHGSTTETTPDILTLHCAVMTAQVHGQIATTPHSELRKLIAVYEQANVSTTLINQLKIELAEPVQAKPDELEKLQDLVDVRNALHTATVVFKDARRRWGPHETIPLISHAAEVGVLLQLAGESRDCVISGLLHDFLEGYTAEHKSDLYDKVRRFGTDVVELVLQISEPAKMIDPVTEKEPLENWRKRKDAVLERLEHDSATSEFASLCAATKISTLAAGNVMLYRQGEFSQWSKGPIGDNLESFLRLRNVHEMKGVSLVLAEQLQLEIDRFVSQLPEKWQAYANAFVSEQRQHRIAI